MDSAPTIEWNRTDFACCSTQSLLIIKILTETCSTQIGKQGNSLLHESCLQIQGQPGANDLSLAPTPTLLSSIDALHASEISLTHQFGFTIGADKTLLECISTITTIGHWIRSDANSNPSNAWIIQETASKILASLNVYEVRLTQCLPPVEKIGRDTSLPDQSERLALYQINAFLYATYIYLHRTLLNAPPSQVANYVTLTFQSISAFNSESNGNFSLWPAFIAAVEAYTPEVMTMSRAWLERSATFGLGNRIAIKQIVEEVWRRRKALCWEEYLDDATDNIGQITVDWRQVAQDLEIDVLLV